MSGQLFILVGLITIIHLPSLDAARIKARNRAEKAEDVDGMPAECTEKLYGYDGGNPEKGRAPRCRCDHFGDNGILDRFAKKICCEAFDAREERRAAKRVAAEQQQLLAAEELEEQKVLAAELAPGRLTIKNIKAFNLPNLNHTWIAGKTDAFTKVWITGPNGKSDVAETPHVNSCLNPEWDWQHTFEIGECSSDVGWTLSLSIWDYDALVPFWWDGHDFIGDLEILFRKMPPGTVQSYSHSIDNEGEAEDHMAHGEKRGDHGTIHFDLVWEPMLD